MVKPNLIIGDQNAGRGHFCLVYRLLEFLDSFKRKSLGTKTILHSSVDSHVF